MKYFVYLVKCADNTLYCGITTNLERRINEHNGIGKKNGAKYTAARRPVVLQWHRAFENRSDASKEEHRIKKLTREKKFEIINKSK